MLETLTEFKKTDAKLRVPAVTKDNVNLTKQLNDGIPLLEQLTNYFCKSNKSRK